VTLEKARETTDGGDASSVGGSARVCVCVFFFLFPYSDARPAQQSARARAVVVAGARAGRLDSIHLVAHLTESDTRPRARRDAPDPSIRLVLFDVGGFCNH
jgi:hypothetical protein